MKMKMGICVSAYKTLEGKMAYRIHLRLQQAVFTSTSTMYALTSGTTILGGLLTHTAVASFH